MARLFTLLHVSDLHIGEIDPVTGNATASSAAAKLFANVPWFDGVLGHHGRALQELQKFYESLIADGEPVQLVVTGDVTRCGNGVEFGTADSFLADRVDLNPPASNFAGFRDRGWVYGAIPGNHDHWSGNPHPFGGPTADMRRWFPKNRFPLVEDLGLSDGRKLRIAFLDTDADVWPFGAARLFARGSFQSQLAALAPMLGSPQPDEIRVLAMHHSWLREGLALSIDKGSKAALAQFVVRQDIRVVLSGHVHEAQIGLFSPAQDQARHVLECRCGTTTQHDHVPYEWRNFVGRFPGRSWPPNTLLVHRLEVENGTTYWDVETFWRGAQNGFVSLAPKGRVRVAV